MLPGFGVANFTRYACSAACGGHGNRLEMKRVPERHSLETQPDRAVIVFAGEQITLLHLRLRRWIVGVGEVQAGVSMVVGEPGGELIRHDGAGQGRQRAAGNRVVAVREADPQGRALGQQALDASMERILIFPIQGHAIAQC